MLDDTHKQKFRSAIEEYYKGKTKEEIDWLYFLFVERFEPKPSKRERKKPKNYAFTYSQHLL